MRAAASGRREKRHPHCAFRVPTSAAPPQARRNRPVTQRRKGIELGNLAARLKYVCLLPATTCKVTCYVTGPPASPTARPCVALVDGFPAGLEIDPGVIDRELSRRQGGYGRGGRQRIESDHVDDPQRPVARQDPGQPDRPAGAQQGCYKLERMEDLRRPAPGSWRPERGHEVPGPDPRDPGAGQRPGDGRPRGGRGPGPATLARFGIYALGLRGPGWAGVADQPLAGTLEEQRAVRDASPLYALDPAKTQEAKALIAQCQKQGDTLGGVIEVRVEGVPFGLGTPRPMGPQARRPDRPGRDVGAGDQGRGDRPGVRGRPAPRLRGPRSDPLRPGAGSTPPRSVSSGPRTTPAGWRRG